MRQGVTFYIAVAAQLQMIRRSNAPINTHPLKGWTSLEGFDPFTEYVEPAANDEEPESPTAA